MTSITPAERAALKVAEAVWESRDTAYGIAGAIVFALGSAQLLQSPESAAELERLRKQVAELEAERHATNEVLHDATVAARSGGAA